MSNRVINTEEPGLHFRLDCRACENTGDNKNQVGRIFSINTEVFLTRNFATALSFEKFSAGDSEGEDQENFTLSFLVRF